MKPIISASPRCTVCCSYSPAVIYLAAELWINPTDRFFDYDEAIYISQSAPSTQPAHWAAHRARGMAWLVAPVAGLGASPPEIRLYLMLLSATLLLLGFAIWVPPRGGSGADRRLVFRRHLAGVVLRRGSDAESLHRTVRPDHSRRVLATTGWRDHAGTGVAAALAMSATALLRPTDASCVLAGLVGLQFVSGRDRNWRGIVSLSIGLSVGWSQWLWEAETGFGGILKRWNTAAAIHGGLGINIVDHLRAADGPLLGGDRVISTGALLWWTGIVAFSVCGIVCGLAPTDVRHHCDDCGLLVDHHLFLPNP